MDPSGDSTTICVVITITLLELSAFFLSSETALTTTNKIRIRTLAEEGSKSVQWVMKLSENQGKMLGAILIGNDVMNLSASSMLTVLVTEIFGNRAAGTATGVLTFLVLILGEIISKITATLDTKRYSLQVGHTIHILMTVLTSLVIPINWMLLIVLKVLHADPDKRNDNITEDELRTTVDVGHEKGVTESEECGMINNVSDLGDLVAKGVMVPRVDMAFVDIEVDYDDLIQIFKEKHYTRLPVYKETTGNVAGIINTKDLLLMESKTSLCVSDYLRQPSYTFGSKKLSELMTETKKSPNNIIIVLDEYGTTAGLTTLEDILERVIGDIHDEYGEDKEEELMDPGSGQYPVGGSMKPDDLNDVLDLELSSEGYNSVGGFVAGRLEHLPSQGEEVMCGSVCLIMKQVEKNRIGRVHLYVFPGEREKG